MGMYPPAPVTHSNEYAACYAITRYYLGLVDIDE